MVYPPFGGSDLTVRRRQLQMTRWVNRVVFAVGQLFLVYPQLRTCRCIAPTDAMGHVRKLAVKALISISANHTSKGECPAELFQRTVRLKARDKVLAVLQRN